MSGDPILVEQFGVFWVVRVPLYFVNAEFRVAVPPGVLVDFASIPRLLWPFFSPIDPRYSRAAVLHDWLYASHTHTRREADRVLYASAREGHTGRGRAFLIWLAVRLFGRGPYRRGPARQLALRRRYEHDTGIALGGPALQEGSR